MGGLYQCVMVIDTVTNNPFCLYSYHPIGFNGYGDVLGVKMNDTTRRIKAFEKTLDDIDKMPALSKAAHALPVAKNLLGFVQELDSRITDLENTIEANNG